MLSFGQRLKLLRKEAGITQAELSEKLMVSVQAVSKWECDNTMPDISQIVPLAAILGVTTDCLLGVGGDEKAEREKLFKKVWEFSSNNEYGVYAKDKNEHDCICKLYLDHIRKYPLDYEVKFRCANEICHYLYNAGHLSYTVSKEEEETLYTDAVNLLTAVVNYDRDTTRILDSKQILIMMYLYKNEFSKAEEVAESLPRIGKVRSAMEIEIYSKKNDSQKCYEISKDACRDAVDNYLWALGVRARKTSALGEDKREEAVRAYRELIDGAKFNYKIFGDIDINIKWMYSAFNYLSNEYISKAQIDKAFETIEELMETIIENFNDLKVKGELKKAQELKSEATEYLHRCYNWCFKNRDNVITNNIRFRKCEEKILELD